jgi:hypothetical protein
MTGFEEMKHHVEMEQAFVSVAGHLFPNNMEIHNALWQLLIDKFCVCLQWTPNSILDGSVVVFGGEPYLKAETSKGLYINMVPSDVGLVKKDPSQPAFYKTPRIEI